MSGKNLWGNRVVPNLSKENQVIQGRELKEKGRIWTRCGPLVESLKIPPQGHKIDPRLSASPGEIVVTNSWFSYESNTLLLEHKTFSNFNGSLKQFLAFGKWNIQEKQSRAIWRPRQYSRGIISGWGPCCGSQALGFQSWGWKVFIRTHWAQRNSLAKKPFSFLGMWTSQASSRIIIYWFYPQHFKVFFLLISWCCAWVASPTPPPTPIFGLVFVEAQAQPPQDGVLGAGASSHTWKSLGIYGVGREKDGRRWEGGGEGSQGTKRGQRRAPSLSQHTDALWPLWQVLSQRRTCSESTAKKQRAPSTKAALLSSVSHADREKEGNLKPQSIILKLQALKTFCLAFILISIQKGGFHFAISTHI